MVNVLTSNQKPTQKPIFKYTVVLMLCGVISLIGVNIFLQVQPSVPQIQPAVKKESMGASEPTGVLYTSMAQKDELVHVIGYYFNNATFESVAALDGATTMQIESTKKAISFLVFAPISGTQKENIIAIDKSTRTMNFVLSSNTTLTNERSLNYSESKKLLAFQAQEQEGVEGTLASADTWGIYVVDPKTQNVDLIGKGIDPVWSPDGTSLVYLGADGIKQYIYADQTTKDIVIPNTAKPQVGTNMNLDITPDGKLLALTSPNNSALYFFDVLSWDRLRLENSKIYSSIINTENNKAYYWPTFSFDNKFIAVQEANYDQNGIKTTATISIIRLSDMNTVRKIPIDSYDFNRAFIDDWEMR